MATAKFAVVRFQLEFGGQSWVFYSKAGKLNKLDSKADKLETAYKRVIKIIRSLKNDIG